MPVLSVSLFKEMGRELGADTAALSASGMLVECRQAPPFKPGCTSQRGQQGRACRCGDPREAVGVVLGPQAAPAPFSASVTSEEWGTGCLAGGRGFGRPWSTRSALLPRQPHGDLTRACGAPGLFRCPSLQASCRGATSHAPSPPAGSFKGQVYMNGCGESWT